MCFSPTIFICWIFSHKRFSLLERNWELFKNERKLSWTKKKSFLNNFWGKHSHLTADHGCSQRDLKFTQFYRKTSFQLSIHFFLPFLSIILKDFSFDNFGSASRESWMETMETRFLFVISISGLDDLIAWTSFVDLLIIFTELDRLLNLLKKVLRAQISSQFAI